MKTFSQIIADMDSPHPYDNDDYCRGYTMARHNAVYHLKKYDNIIHIFREMLDDYKLACEEWDAENQEYGLDLIEKAEKMLKSLEDEE